jgi:hypothetical protein
MKSAIFLFLFASIISSCADGNKQNSKSMAREDSSAIGETHPNDLFKNNCSMCHAYNKELPTAPAIISYSVDSILNFYDGKSRRDSIWQQHKKIQLTRNEWKRIAIQVQPGDVFKK